MKAQKITDETAIKCILGEAAGESEIGKTAVAEVLRRRGSVKGFVGCNAVGKPSDELKREALKAWRRSRWTNYSRSATHFENVRAFGNPWWCDGMRPVKRIGGHQFWRD